MTNWTKMQIDTGNSKPVSQKPYPMAMKHYDWVKDEIKKLLGAKVIHSSQSSWSVPIIVVLKDDGEKCIVIDYRTLNKVTQKFIWPMPKVKDIFSKLNGVTYFSTLDLWAGYHHIPLDDASIPKTAFTWPLEIWELESFLQTSTSTYILSGTNEQGLEGPTFAIAFLDDIIIYSKTAADHLKHLQQVFHKLWNAKLSMKLSKCHLFK